MFLIILVFLSFLFSGGELWGKAEGRRLPSTEPEAALGLGTDFFLSAAGYIGEKSLL